ncbi:MAG TPA: cupin-like domain-containing protein [Allosphingosinicella sp.]|nr:cupin-like domain-containing protein [Allosphingosinicella sp.]
MSESVFDEGGRRRLGADYPSRPVALSHSVVGHKLFTLDALTGLARRMDAADILSNLADLPIEVAPEGVHSVSPDPAAIIASIGEQCSWMVFRHVQKDPDYGALLGRMVAELAPIVAPRTGGIHAVKGFIFISSPGAVTPFHFDPEYNILMQLGGDKVMTLFPAYDDNLVSEDAHERLHTHGHVNIPWRDEMAEAGQAFPLAPGDALFVPFKAPHWVKNGPSVSISLSITWQTEWSHAEADARMMNVTLRRWGRKPRPLLAYPSRNRMKSLAWRALRRTGAFSPRP